MSTIHDPSCPPSSADHDALLLEGLFQLAIAGETGGELEKIEGEVYARLLDAYDDVSGRSAG